MAVLGIDLGKATCTAVVEMGDGSNAVELHVAPVVALTSKNEWLVGDEARLAASAGRGEAVWDVLELQGRKMSDFTPAQIASWPFRLVQGTAGKALVEFHTKSAFQRAVFPPEELLAVLLAHIRHLAEQRCSCVLDHAVFTVPASWNYTQRRALRDASEMAGLTPLRLVVSSTAAAMAYAAQRTPKEQDTGDQPQILLVVDFGAGSINLSLVSIQSPRRLEVKAVIGDSTLGGVTLTERVVDYFVRQSNAQMSTITTKTIHRLRRASQLAKKMLTKSETASVQLQLEATTFTGSITRVQFEAGCLDCWDRIRTLVQVVLNESHVAKEQVDGVLLCGGSAVVPAVQKLTKNLFPAAADVSVNVTGNLQAHGAAILAASLTATVPTVELLDVAPLALGVQRVGARDVTVLVPANSRLPFVGENLFFAGYQKTDLVYSILEGRNLRQVGLAAAQSHGQSDAGALTAHCIGTTRLARATAAPTALAVIVMKLTIKFELDENLVLSVTIVDLATRHSTHSTFAGDDTVLPRDTIERAKKEMDTLFGGHQAAFARGHAAWVTRKSSLPLHASSDGSAQDERTTDSDNDAAASSAVALQEYALGLRAMVDSNKLEIHITQDEKLILTTKIDNVLEWLHSTTKTNKTNESNNQQNQQPTIRNSTDNDQMNGEWNEKTTTSTVPVDGQQTMDAHLQSLRRLHLSIAASCAIAQLRDTSL